MNNNITLEYLDELDNGLIKNKDGQRIAEIGNQSVTSLVKLQFPYLDQTMSLDIVAIINYP